MKNRDSHLVELLILRLVVFFICVFIKNCVFHRPAKFGQFSVSVDRKTTLGSSDRSYRGCHTGKHFRLSKCRAGRQLAPGGCRTHGGRSVRRLTDTPARCAPERARLRRVTASVFNNRTWRAPGYECAASGDWSLALEKHVIDQRQRPD